MPRILFRSRVLPTLVKKPLPDSVTGYWTTFSRVKPGARLMVQVKAGSFHDSRRNVWLVKAEAGYPHSAWVAGQPRTKGNRYMLFPDERVFVTNLQDIGT